MSTDPHQIARDFIENQKQFQLGFLTTEKPHPETAGLSDACAKDLRSGIRMLAKVDRDVLRKAEEFFGSDEFEELKRSFRETLSSGGRIIFSGCGATGRLCILLEAAWRKACSRLSSAEEASEQVGSMMTGGDYALVRSVESFEDYASFGERQSEESGAGAEDTFVAVSEGGETSSVIGSALKAAESGSRVFFVFNNPAEVLCKNIERSRTAINHPRIRAIDLCTGPMALAGSTRMQAATIELLVLGKALEEVFCALFVKDDGRYLSGSCEVFERLLDDLSRPASAEAMAAWAEYEADLYSQKGLVTYFADGVLLDIFTDTTERAPTFMIPPFVKDGDDASPQSWAFVKNPICSSREAWIRVFGRKPECLEWDSAVYSDLGASDRIIANPPAIGYEEILKFNIGSGVDERRLHAPRAAAVGVVSMADAEAGITAFLEGFGRAMRDYSESRLFSIGGPGVGGDALVIPCSIVGSPLNLWEHLAVKIIMNTVSTAAMARMGRVEGNWMAWVNPTNKKLIDRASRLISELGGVSYPKACEALFTAIIETEKSGHGGREAPSPVQCALANLKAASRKS